MNVWLPCSFDGGVILFTGGGMERKQNRTETCRPWPAAPGRGLPQAMGVIFVLLFFALFCPSAHAIGPYTSGNNTVVDQGTGLEWQKSDDAVARNWQDALAYCEDLSLASKADWRLPNIRELKSIVRESRYYPATDPAFVSHSSNYWSATSVAGHPVAHAWSVHFGNGDDNWYVKTSRYRVRCVRAGTFCQP